jgi:putative glutamine amidotransferase
MPVNSRHAQGVSTVAKGVRISARAPDGVVEAIERADLPFWLAVQWHPEFHISPGDAKLLEAFVAAAAQERDAR